MALRTKDDREAELAAQSARLSLSSDASLIVCAGIPRSGSTWLYNAVRLLVLREVGEDQVYGAWIDRYEASNPARRHVVKIHDANEPLAWRAKCVLTSRRDLRDIAASAWKRNWISDAPATITFLDSVVAQHAFWKARAAHEMTYEVMRDDPRSELASIAASLELKLDDSAIDATLAMIDSLAHDDSSEDDFNASNLMHKQHIMDGRVGYHAETLPAELLATINDRYREWLLANGYAV